MFRRRSFRSREPWYLPLQCQAVPIARYKLRDICLPNALLSKSTEAAPAEEEESVFGPSDVSRVVCNALWVGSRW